jgi:hypothetical protein
VGYTIFSGAENNLLPCGNNGPAFLDSHGFDPRARQRTVTTAVDRLQDIRDINSSYAILYKLLYKALTLQKDAKHSVVQGLVEKIRRSSKAEKFCCCSLGNCSHDISKL